MVSVSESVCKYVYLGDISFPSTSNFAVDNLLLVESVGNFCIMGK